MREGDNQGVWIYCGHCSHWTIGLHWLAQIPQVDIPADGDAPRRFGLLWKTAPWPMEWRGAPMGREFGMVGLGIIWHLLYSQFQAAAGWMHLWPILFLVLQNVAATIRTGSATMGWCTFDESCSLFHLHHNCQQKGERERGGFWPIAQPLVVRQDPALRVAWRGHIACTEGKNFDTMHIWSSYRAENMQ